MGKKRRNPVKICPFIQWIISYLGKKRRNPAQICPFIKNLEQCRNCISSIIFG